ncbi:hypothetical protein SZ55_2933 [Pseudomonas sp. FeS53a]|nr:hypothetical protein SZ55_2933 [Pseudomonas sp. FeS53a]
MRESGLHAKAIIWPAVLCLACTPGLWTCCSDSVLLEVSLFTRPLLPLAGEGRAGCGRAAVSGVSQR